MKRLAPIFCLFLIACGPPNPDQLPPDVTEPDYPILCDPDQNPQEKIELKFYWQASKNIGRAAFTEACGYFEDLGITCAETESPSEADVWIFSDNGYFYCDGNARIENPARAFQRVQIILNESCMPQDSEALDWQREVFAKKIGELFGVTPYPGFCGGGNFANYVDRWWFRAPYDGPLTNPDEIAWYSRDRSRAYFGTKEPAPYCGPDLDAVPDICATPTEPINSFIVSIYATPDLWEEALFACNLWTPLGITCLSAPRDDAFIAVFKNQFDKCEPAGRTEFGFYYGQWVVSISSCLDRQEAIRQIAHQIGHAFGLPHIPEWCAVALMNPSPRADCLTWSDFSVWPEQYPDFYKVYE